MKPWHAAVLVFLCALVMRLSLLYTARFGGDEALFFRIGMDIVELKSWPLLGTQITDGRGLLPGPAFLYLMALPLVFVRAPEAQYAFVEVLGACTVLLFWHAMRRPFGERAAFFAGMLMSFSPWSTLYADRTWNPNVLPFFVVLALLAALRVRDDPRSRWLAVFLPACAVMPHFHMSAPVAWAGLAVLVAPTVRRWDRKWLAWGLAISFVLYIPLLANEIHTGFGNTRNIFAETVGNTAGHERHATSFLWIPVYALRFLTLDATYHELTGYWGGPDEVACLKAAWLGTPPRPHHPLRVLALACSLVLAGLAFWRARRAWRSPWLLAFAAALVVNMALLGLAGKQVFGHYVTNLFPFVFVVYAALGRVLDARTRMRAVIVALGLVFCIGGAEVTWMVSRRVDARIGLEVHRKTMERIGEDAAREGFDRVRLDSFLASNYDWAIFSSRAMGLTLRFDKNAPAHYRLVDKRKIPAGRFKDGPIDVGHALLYRVK
jgi:4-amino-4-deoxy-L-arabinose transferase-like glycosyltransferase